jgi:hypothetical protein
MDNKKTNAQYSKFFNTGYLSNHIITEVRQKQGLQSQDLSNSCTEHPRVLYPMPATPLPTYGLPPISPNNPCLIYLRPP